MSKNDGAEQRRAKRTVVQESFNLFLVIPSVHGMVRIYIKDISRVGIRFQSEIDDAIKVGDQLDARLYLNPAFYLPFQGAVVRAEKGEIALEFNDPASPSAVAVGKLQDFLEAAEKAGVMIL
ncbi:MAG: PilZ domain-containing protein [Oligoflexia bacterium]|nr:PilZ domain-containing protein [Oligoflexia bacterium]